MSLRDFERAFARAERQLDEAERELNSFCKLTLLGLIGTKTAPGPEVERELKTLDATRKVAFEAYDRAYYELQKARAKAVAK